MDVINTIPDVLLNFVLVTVFSLIIGLSQKNLHHKKDIQQLFGTDRTFTFIGILGYILFILDPGRMIPFIAGALILTTFFAIYYVNRVKETKHYGITTIIIAILTYSAPALLVVQPIWLYLLVMVTLLVFSELKDRLTDFSSLMDREEFLTLAKFLIIAGIILPILPKNNLVPYLSLTPYNIWMAVVIISSISYVSYLLKKFVFKKAGILLSGILGGLYSSTATTVVLARKSRESSPDLQQQYVGAIVMATSMMFLRILILILIFNKELFSLLVYHFVFLFLFSLILGLIIYWRGGKNKVQEISTPGEDKNPLEFRVALLFTLLFVAFSFITYFTLSHFGEMGLSILSFIIGFTDVDPFLINLFQGKFTIPLNMVGIAALQAIVSNNLAKAIFASSFGRQGMWRKIFIPFALIITACFASILIL